jgi:hypothetical protein
MFQTSIKWAPAMEPSFGTLFSGTNLLLIHFAYTAGEG